MSVLFLANSITLFNNKFNFKHAYEKIRLDYQLSFFLFQEHVSSNKKEKDHNPTV